MKDHHGLTGSAEYRAWKAMKARCYNQRSPQYRNYGARGIRVCERWRNSAAAFLGDVGTRPSKSLSIDRVNNEGHYSCGNCSDCTENGWPMNLRWATPTEQSANLRKNVKVTHNGETLNIAEWARRSPAQIDSSTLYRRLFVSKWDMDRALTTPKIEHTQKLRSRRDALTIVIDGKEYRVAEWARTLGISYSKAYYLAKRQQAAAKAE